MESDFQLRTIRVRVLKIFYHFIILPVLLMGVWGSETKGKNYDQRSRKINER